MSGFEPAKLANILSKRFGISFSGTIEELDGGIYSVIRPDDLPNPHGFKVAIAMTPGKVEASFHPDNFSGSLIREMGEFDDASLSTFSSIQDSLIESGVTMSLLINGNPHSVLTDELRNEVWEKIELECVQRFPQKEKKTDELIQVCVDKATSACMMLILSLLKVEEVTDSVPGFEIGLPEGSKIKVEVNRYERSPINRSACISHFGPICQACGFDFGKIYGEIGQDFIEVHHLIPISQMGGSYNLNPITDLITVCSNCHSMIHRKNPPFTIKEIRDRINETNL